ncbi:hypothetical protein BDZ94DRAFT_1320423 [Collybia nuda]|uniref:Uncharacterized protein n=1 Tax=Collybia nuda TaxID=64659 RepID=A0A9P6CLX8_9AGAR|nr:hypothetical protein BDZ94DRAFT_1320423 [Collybia nuda]
MDVGTLDEILGLQRMHRCLLIPEIVRLICSEVDRSFVGAERRRTVKALAQTCRLFQEPALDILWRKLDSLTPLIKCIPSGLWGLEREALDESVGSLALRRAVIPTDWERFLVHAQRVQKFTARRLPRSRLNYDEYQALDTAAKPEVLLPNLRKLTWLERRDQFFPFIRLFLGPNLQELVLGIDGSPLIRLPLLSTLPSRFPMLTHLELEGTPRPSIAPLNASHIRTVSTALCGWSHLQSLSIGWITAKALVHIATLPALQKLMLRNNSLRLPSGFPFSGEALAFPSLQDLCINCKYLTFCTPLIQSMSNQQLKSISIRTGEISCSSARKFFIALEEHCAHDTLRELMVSPICSWEGENSDPILLEDIKPLFAFPYLTKVKLASPTPLGLRDQDMEVLASAWRHLHTLSLDNSPRPGRTPILTLQALIPLARYCKNLASLTILIDARILPPRERRREITDGSTKSIWIHVMDSPVNNAKSVAVVLTRIFPNIDSLEYDIDGEEYYVPVTEPNPEWSRINDILSTLVAVRPEERERQEESDEDSDTDPIESEIRMEETLPLRRSVFPNLTGVMSYDQDMEDINSDDEEYGIRMHSDEDWAKVERFLEIFPDICTSERERWALENSIEP